MLTRMVIVLAISVTGIVVGNAAVLYQHIDSSGFCSEGIEAFGNTSR